MNTATAAVAATYLASLAQRFPQATPEDHAYVAKHATGETLERGTQHMLARLLMERIVVRSAATELIAAGYTLRVHDGEAMACAATQDVAVIMDAIMSVDEEELVVMRRDTRTTEEGRTPSGFLRCGFVSLVYGNDGYDVICDNAISLERHLRATNALIRTLESA